MALSPNLYALKVQRLETILAQKAAPKVPERRSYGNFCKVTQNPHFVKKCKGGTKVSLSKIAKKSSPRFKGLRALWRKRHYPLISIHFKCRNWKRFSRKQRLQKCPNGQVMAIFARSPKSRIFWKSAKGGPKEIFKYRPKRCPPLKGPKAYWRKWHYPLISVRLKCKNWRRFRHKQRLKKGPNGEVMAIFGRSPKTCIFRKSAKGRPREVFQKSPKKYPRFKRPTALWRKCHYPLNCIHL